MKNRYTQKQITDVLKIKRTRLRQWIEHGYVAPSVTKSTIQGERNIWSFSDMVMLASFNQVLKNGLSRTSAAKMLKAEHIYMTVGGVQKKRTSPWAFLGSKDCPLNSHPTFITLQNGNNARYFCAYFEERGPKDHLQTMLESLGFQWEWMVFFDIGEIRDRLAVELEWVHRKTDEAGSESRAPYPAP